MIKNSPLKLNSSSHRLVFITLVLVAGIVMYPNGLHAFKNDANLPTNSYVLENERLKATLNQNGLVNFYDRQLRKDYKFVEDGFTITLDGRLISKNNLAPVSVTKKDNQVIYNLSDSVYDVRVVYELKPSWNFISKRLEITPKTSRRFMVNQVTALQVKLSRSVVTDFIPKTWMPKYGTRNYGAFLRFSDGTGLMTLVQNPFLDYTRDGNSFSLSYSPDMEWDKSYGVFASDRACIGAYTLTGRKILANMVPEWKWTGGILPEGPTQDEAEVKVFTDCVEQFIQDKTPRPINVHVGWCENDFQEDVSMSSGREVYKRIIDQAAEVGSKYLVYTPLTSDLGTHVETADAWQAECFLWLGMGIKLRKNEWKTATDNIPASIQELLDYAKKRDIKLLAYVYPGMPFQQNPGWLVNYVEGGIKKQYANLGFRELQDWLINEMTVFMEKTGIGGYSFDYTFLMYPGKSVYAQWHGWCRVMEALRSRFPNIIMDGRQSYQYYGPWSWVAGSYPHPTSNDEQAMSFINFPDLHFDRTSANRERYTTYRYRINDYCPSLLMPGYITHQTPRFNVNNQMVREPFRIRDWDYLGWKYSLISSIAMGGLNNVINMIPARDPEEYRYFSDSDKAFLKKWLKWTSDNRSYLERAIPIMGQPAIGKTDGATAIIGNKGYIFIYNPNGRSMHARFTLDESINLSKAKNFILKELYPLEGRLIGKPGAGAWSYGDAVTVPMDGASAIVFSIEPVRVNESKPVLYNLAGNARLNGNILILDSINAEKGTTANALVELPAGKKIDSMYINQQPVAFSQDGKIVSASLRFDEDAFPHMNQVGVYDPNFTKGIYNATFHIPQRIFDQLKERKRRWPIPWTDIDFDTPWLVPHRLLLFVQIADPSDTLEVTMKINGTVVPLKKAYSELRKVSHTFLGFYVDLSSSVAEKDYNVELQLPQLAPGQFQGLFFENIETEYTGKLAGTQR